MKPLKMLSLFLFIGIEAFSQTYAIKLPTGTDISTILQSAVNANKIVTIEGSYILSKTVTIPSGVTIKRTKSALLRASNSPTGELASMGRFFIINGGNVLINQITFKEADQPIRQDKWQAAVILVRGANCKVTNCTFDFTLPYGLQYRGIWITGTTANSNEVRANTFNTLGVLYEDGSSKNSITENTFNKPSSNAIDGIGNNRTIPTSNNVISKNIIRNAGRMGIEVQQNDQAVTISYNRITGVGKHPAFNDAFIAISSVGYSSKVYENIIYDFAAAGIELTGNSKHNCYDNFVYGENAYECIIANYTDGSMTANKALGVTITNNTLVGSKIGISLFGDNYINAAIKGNKLIDFKEKGVALQPGKAVNINVSITDNDFLIKEKGTTTRVGILTVNSVDKAQAKHSLLISNNKFNYSPSVNGGVGEVAIGYSTNNVTIKGNEVQGNNVSNAYGWKVSAISFFGASNSESTIEGNVFEGSFTDLRDLKVKPKMSGNKMSNILGQWKDDN